MNQTTVIKPGTTNQKWILVDAKDAVVGRLATRIAMVLQGKSKPEYQPNIDNGDYVVVINADKVKITGSKDGSKVYRYHTLYPGGLKEVSYKRMMDNHPERILAYAVKRMLPKTKMGKAMLKKLHVYAGETHPHGAQTPVPTDLGTRRIEA